MQRNSTISPHPAGARAGALPGGGGGDGNGIGGMRGRGLEDEVARGAAISYDIGGEVFVESRICSPERKIYLNLSPIGCV